MFRIGDFSRLARVTIKTLHHYDEAGLLTPAHVDRNTGYRYYIATQLETLQRIRLLRDLGFSLEEIRDLLHADFGSSAVAAQLEARRDALAHSIEADQARLRRFDALRDSLEGSRIVPLTITVCEIPPLDVHAVRALVPRLGLPVQELFEAAEAAVAARAARADASPLLIFHDTEYRDTDVDVEVCIPVQQGADIDTRRIDGVAAAACLTYRGAYEQTPQLLRSMVKWLHASGLALAGSPPGAGMTGAAAIAGPLREVYHRYGAEQVGYRLPTRVLAQSSEEYVTELQIPVTQS